MMRLFFFLGVLAVIGLIVTGAITLSRSKTDQTITIQIDKDRVKQDAAKAFEKGKEVFEDAESALRNSMRDSGTNR